MTPTPSPVLSVPRIGCNRWASRFIAAFLQGESSQLVVSGRLEKTARVFWETEAKKQNFDIRWGRESFSLSKSPDKKKAASQGPALAKSDDGFCDTEKPLLSLIEGQVSVILPMCQVLSWLLVTTLVTRVHLFHQTVRFSRFHHLPLSFELFEFLRALGSRVVLGETQRDTVGLWSLVDFSPGPFRVLDFQEPQPWWDALLRSPYFDCVLILLSHTTVEHRFPESKALRERLDRFHSSVGETFAVRSFEGTILIRPRRPVLLQTWLASPEIRARVEMHVRDPLGVIDEILETITALQEAPMRRSKEKRYLVAIDGPAGAGKSTVSKLLARRIGYQLIDTGAMFRSVGYCAVRDRVNEDDICALEEIADHLEFEFRVVDGDNQVWVRFHDAEAENWSDRIRTSEIGAKASQVSLVPTVRTILLEKQRRMGARGAVVMEGRDIGSVVFPDAEMKFFLTASVRARAQRRWRELVSRGELSRLEDVEEEIRKRDEQDTNRPVAPLMVAPGAELVDASELSLLETVDLLEKRFMEFRS